MLDRTQFTVYESIIQPITAWLKNSGVQFHFNAKVKDLEMDLDNDMSGDPTTVSEIIIRENESEHTVKLNPSDITIVTIGSTNSGLQLGTN
jgi:oleate hydratase